MPPKKICAHLAFAICVLMLAGCAARTIEPVSFADSRDGHVEELVREVSSTVESGAVVVSMKVVLAKHPFQPEDLRLVSIPISNIRQDDLTDCPIAAGRLARNTFPSGHIIRQRDLLPQGFHENWRPIHRAKKTISAKELLTEKNTLACYVRISDKGATQDILMHTAVHAFQQGELIHNSDVGPDLWEYVYYAKVLIAKGEVVCPGKIELRVVEASDLDEEWNYADCHDTTEAIHASKDIKCGAPIRCSDIE